jgi:hypothetical protein
MDPIVVRADVDAVLAGLFDVNAKLTTIGEDIATIRRLFEDGDDEEEEEGNG